jgi:hypothetical protein
MRVPPEGSLRTGEDLGTIPGGIRKLGHKEKCWMYVESGIIRIILGRSPENKKIRTRLCAYKGKYINAGTKNRQPGKSAYLQVIHTWYY